MSYYKNQTLFEELIITGTQEEDYYYGEIDIFNNDSIYLKLEGISLPNKNIDNLTNEESVSLLRVDIEWGDGETTTLTPVNFVQNQETTGSIIDSWLNNSHTYHFYEEVDKTKLKIKLYNTLNDSVTITVDINVRYKSISEAGVRYELVSANITNDNRVSYIINEGSTKQMIVLNSVAEDWVEDKSFYDKTKLFGTNVVSNG